MKRSSLWNIAVYAVAVFYFTLCIPAFLVLVVAKFLDYLSSFYLEAFSENPISAYLIKKRETAKEIENATPAVDIEVV